MAKKLNYEIGFTGDTKQLQQAIDTAVKSLQKLGTNSSFQLTSGLKEASKSALDLATNLQKAVNQNTGKLDLIDFEKSLKSSGKSLTQYADELSKLGPQGQQAFLNVASAITQAELPLKRSNKLMTELWITMKNTARWQLTSSALHGFMGALSTAYGYSKDLNRSLTDIRIVSGQSAEEMKEFAEQANKAAKALNATTVDYTDAALIYYQQGLDQDAVEERTNATIKMANVTGETAQTVSDQMTAIWNNYDDGSKKLEYYADVITALGAATASSSGEIAQGLEKFSAIAGQVGLSYEYATSALATVTATTRESADVVGTAFKTLFARIQGLSLGETLDDGTNLNKYSEALQKVGINIFEQNGELKAMDKILDEMGSKWETLSNAQQVALAQTVAGVRQYNQLMTLMGNWDFFKENLAVAQGSEGELQKQADIYAESWEAARDRVRASAEDIYDSIINPDLFIELDNTVAPLLTTIADIIDSMGGLEGVIVSTAFAFTKLYDSKIQEGLRKTYDNIKILTGAAGQASREFQGDTVENVHNLPMTYTADKGLQTQLNIMQQEVELQGTINKKAAELSEYQLQHIENEKNKINLLKMQAIESGNLASTLALETANLKDDIFIDVSLAKGWKERLKQELNKADDLDLAKTIFGSKGTISDLGGLSNAQKMVDQVTSEMKKLIRTSSNLNMLKSELGAIDKITDETASSFKEAAKSLKLLSQTELDAIGNDTEALRQKFQTLNKEASVSNKRVGELKKVLSTLGGNSTQIDAYVSKMRELEVQLSKNRISIDEYNRKIQELNNNIINNNIPNLNDWATKFTKVANGMMSIGMSMQALSSMKQILTKEDVTIWEALISILTSAALIAPTISLVAQGATAFKTMQTAVASVIPTLYELSIAQVNQEIVTQAQVKAFIGKNKTLGIMNSLLWKQTAAEKAAITTNAQLAKAIASNFAMYLPLVIALGLAVAAYEEFVVTSKEASESIKETNDSYDEEKSKLEELNSSLETTKNRIDELQSKGTLSFVEQQELAKLKLQNKLLESQAEIQERITRRARKASYTNTANTLNSLNTLPEMDNTSTRQFLETDVSQRTGGSYVGVDLNKDEWREMAISQGKMDMAEINEYYEAWASTDSEIRQDISEKNSELYAETNESYSNMLQDMLDGELARNDESLKATAKWLSDYNKMIHGEDWEEAFVSPIADSTAFKENNDAIYTAFAEGRDIQDIAQNVVSQDLTLEILVNQMPVEEYLGIVQNKIEETKQKLAETNVNWRENGFSSEEINDMLNSDEWELIQQINWDQVFDRESFYEQLNYVKEEAKKVLDEQLVASAEKIGEFRIEYAAGMSTDDVLASEGYSELLSILPDLKFHYEELSAAADILSNKNLIGTQIWVEALGQVQEKMNEVKMTELEENLSETVDEVLDKVARQNRDGFTIEAFLDSDSFEEDLDAILDADYQIGIQIHTEAEQAYEATQNAIKNIQEDAALIGDNFVVAAEDVRELNNTFPGIIQGITDLNNGTMQLNAEAVKSSMDAARLEVANDVDTTITKLENTATELRAKQKTYQAMANAAKQLAESDTKTDRQSARNKAIIQNGLNSMREESTNAELEDQEKVATNAKDNAQITAENWDTAYANAAKSAFTFAKQAAAAHKAAVLGTDPANYTGDFGVNYSGFTGGKSAEATQLDEYQALFDSGTDEDYNKLYEAFSNAADTFGSWANDIEGMAAGIGGSLIESAKTFQNVAKGLGSDGKKDGGGGSSKTAEDKSKEKERYHEINRTLEDQEQLLSEIEKQAERTYGLDRLKLYEKELEEINKQTAYEQMKLAQAGTYLQTDTQALRNLKLNVQFKENGEIANWNAIIDQTIAEYKAGIAGATEEEAKAVQEMYDKRIAAIEKYEESINTFQEQQEKVWDGLRKARDAELRNTTYKLDVLLNVKNMKDAAREFSQAVTESFSDSLYHGIDSAKLGAEGAKAEMALLGEYQQQQADLQKLLDNADEFTSTEDIIAEMEELQGNVIASGEALLDWIETVETMLPEAIDAARERFSLFTDQLDHNTSVLDTIKELLSLQGVTYKTSRGFNTLQEVSQEKLDAAVASAELQKGWMERARTELLEAQHALEQVEEGDAAYDTLKNNRDALLEEYNSAQAAMLESAQEAMEVAREMFLTEIEKASYDFSKAISDGLGLDLLQERYDHLIEEEERYLDEVNTTYEQLKWNSKLQTAIDEASSLASKNSLKNLQEEFEQRKKNGEISQYDLDILNAKYEMTQKQIALEEAQNNKSQVRLVRNSQGNWDYQYTSDQSTIDNANQEYADAANEYYNIAKDQVKDVTEEIVATWQECNEKVKEIYEDETLTVAEREARIAEIREFYSEKILYLEEQKNNALKDMTAAGGEIIGEYGNTYQDVIDLMQDGTADFNEAFNEYLDDMEDAWNDYDETVGDVADSTGTEMGDLKDIIDEVSESTDDCREVGEELSEMMWDQIDDIHDLSQEYADWADEIYGVVEALRALAVAQGQAAEDASQESGANRDTTASSGRGYNASIDYASIIGVGVQNGWLSSGEVSKLESERDAKIEGEGLRDKYSSDVDWETIKVGSMTKEQWEKLLDKTVSLNTGGYTGDFSDSKLAFLHEKELVLNQTDTENILATVSMIRSIGPALLKQIETALDNNAIAGANLFNMKMGAAISADTTTHELLQTVHVTAEFPNATDQNEIREAILGLANYATQVVNPR